MENIADLKIRVLASNNRDLVSNTVYAVASLIHRVAGLRSEMKEDYSAGYTSPEKAAVDLANHVITEFEISNTLYFSVKKLTMEMGVISAQLRGHHFSKPIVQRNVLKAVTYHDLHFNASKGYMDLTIDI